MYSRNRFFGNTFRKLALLVAACAALAAARAADKLDAADLGTQTAVRAVDVAAANLYGTLSQKEQNLCFSPYSISSAFAMTYAGAKGDTAREMRHVLGFGSDIHASNKTLRQKFLSAPKESGELLVANSLWPQKKFPLKTGFLDALRKNYGAQVHPQNYAKDPAKAAGIINAWVAENTRDRIKDILAPDGVDANTRLVLVNAVYFKAPWMKSFESARTQEADFHTSSGATLRVDMMNDTDRLPYAETAEAQILKLPYARGTYSMLVILPKNSAALALVESSLTAEAIARYRKLPSAKRVNVFLPKFKIESSFELSRAMQSLGMKKPFDASRADFSGMDGRRDLFIGAAIHKAFIEVDENGTEAAAATAIAMVKSSMPMQEEAPVVFRADRPFLYMILDDASGAVLFLGKVERPGAI